MTKALDARIRNVESASYGDSLTEAAVANSLGVEATQPAHDLLACLRTRWPTTASGTQTGYGFVVARAVADLDLVRGRARRGRARVPPARRPADRESHGSR